MWQVPYESYKGFDMNVDNNRNWNAWIYFDGELWGADDIGNMNMAYIGYKLGLGEYVYNNFVTRNQGNLVTPDLRDIRAIEYGVMLAELGR
jgi:hypothetical protein